MERNMIFHLPFKPSDKASASQIRPLKMLEAFKELGYGVDTVVGDSQERRSSIKDIKIKIKGGKRYDFLYSESSTMPTLLTDSHHLPLSPLLDFSFFSFCKKNEIPIGLFYRDIHWRFHHYTDNVEFLKRTFAKIFYLYDFVQYKKFVDILFLPSLKMGRYIPELSNLKIFALPPGADTNIIAKKVKDTKLTLLYVGGLGDLYNLDLILTILKKFKKEEIKFILCCRKEEFIDFSNKINLDGLSGILEVVHKNGRDLEDLYVKADVCCLFVEPTEYWEFALPVKLFEYLAYEKPILSVKNTAVGDFVEDSKIGWSIPYVEESIYELLFELSNNPNTLRSFDDNLAKKRIDNTWNSRASEVAANLKK